MQMDSDPALQDTPEGAADLDGDGSPAAFVAGVVLGALLGAGIALMLAPDAGPRTRRKVGRRMRSLGDRALEELDDATREQRRNLRREVGRRRKRLERRWRDSVSDRF
jgi:gas vesicle protein